jgi:hypothetical protein
MLLKNKTGGRVAFPPVWLHLIWIKRSLSAQAKDDLLISRINVLIQMEKIVGIVLFLQFL